MSGRRLLAGALLLAALAGGCASSRPETVPPTGTLRLDDVAERLSRLGAEGVGEGAVALVLPPSSPGRPSRLVLARSADAAPERVLDVVFDVRRYGELLDGLETVWVEPRGERTVDVRARLALPLGSLDYVLRLERSPGRVDVVGLEGDLAGGRWTWTARPQGGGALVVYASEAEIGPEAGFFVRRVLALDPDLGPGLRFSQGLRFLNAVCAAAEGPRDASERD